MIFGPFPHSFIDKLKGLLEKEGASYEVFSSEEDIKRIHQENQNREITEYPTFRGFQDYIYIEIPVEHISIVKAELEKMIGPLDGKENGELEQSDEFLCSLCDYVSKNPGKCPKHEIMLLEFSDWSKAKSLQSTNRTVKLFAVVIALVGFCFFIARLI